MNFLSVFCNKIICYSFKEQRVHVMRNSDSSIRTIIFEKHRFDESKVLTHAILKGAEIHTNEDGFKHRTNGLPAIISPTGLKAWYHNGNLFYLVQVSEGGYFVIYINEDYYDKYTYRSEIILF